MSKRGLTLQHYAFDTGVLNLIPTSNEAYVTCETCSKTILKKRKSEFREGFERMLISSISSKLAALQQHQFPTNNEVSIFIIQYFNSQEEYSSTDLDNMAKTILDILKGQFYKNDSQVRQLLMLKKKTDSHIPQNFTYIAVNELKDNRDSDIIKAAGIVRAVTLYNETVKKA
jgi:Holliday junction resolvase RusA-like endonuclease